MEETKEPLFSGNNVAKNSIWSIGEKVFAQLVAFIISVILARLLSPNDYGIVALIQAIINFCSFLVERGFGQALVQKKKPDSLDYWSVLIFSLVASFVLYVLLFIFSYNIASFFKSYDPSAVSSMIKVMGLTLPISSINMVQKAHISKKMQFKKFFWATFVGTVLSGVVGIVIAILGGGAWALVAQYGINLFIDTVILLIVMKPKIKLQFSWQRLKELFSFGWKIVAYGIFGTIADTVRSTMIAREHSPNNLAYYNKGESLPKIVVGTFSVSVGNVVFPALSDFQNDAEKLKETTRRFVRASSYIIFPAMIGFFAVSDILIVLLFGSQWAPAVPFLKIFALIYIFYPLQDAFLLSLKAIKKSGLVAICGIFGDILTLIILFLLVRQGTIYLAIGYFGAVLLKVIYQSVILQKFINYSIKEQLLDFLTFLFVSLLMGVPVYLLHFIEINNIILLFIQVFLGMGLYWLFSIIFKLPEYKLFYNFGKRILKKREIKMKKF